MQTSLYNIISKNYLNYLKIFFYVYNFNWVTLHVHYCNYVAHDNDI